MELIYILVYYCLLAILLQSEILKGTVSEVAAKLGGLLGFGSSLAGGAISLGLCLAAIIDNRRKLLTSHVEVLKTELRKVKTDYEVTKVMNAEKVTGRMAGRD